jgi:hypothetical protein
MDGKFDEHGSLGDAEHLSTDVHDAPTEFETEVEGAATPYLGQHHSDRLQAVLAEMEKIVLAKFRYPDIGAPRLRLHDVRVETAQTNRELPLGLRWIGFGEIEMQIRHGWPHMSASGI